MLRSSIARGLGKMSGVDVVAAATFLEALKLIDARPPSLVVSDIDLPDRSGLELVGELSRRGIRAPIIFVTAYLKTYRSRIPQRPDILVLEKPVPLDTLRARVAERMDVGVDRSRVPFSVADYVQLACMGRHSVIIEVEQRGLAVGRVVVFHGELWSASDGSGGGEAAFRRLAFVADDAVRCVSLPGDPGVRDVNGRFDALVLEAARQQDEAARDGREELETDDFRLDLIDEEPVHQGPAQSFDELWEEGVDALLTHDYPKAERAFEAANRLRPDDKRVVANLARLHQLGYPPGGARGA